MAVNVKGFSDAELKDILEVIDSVRLNGNLADCMFHCSGNNPDRDCDLIDHYNENVRDGVTLKIGIEKIDFHCCGAMEYLTLPAQKVGR